jgi:hypothetical protein
LAAGKLEHPNLPIPSLPDLGIKHNNAAAQVTRPGRPTKPNRRLVVETQQHRINYKYNCKQISAIYLDAFPSIFQTKSLEHPSKQADLPRLSQTKPQTCNINSAA